MYMYIIFIFIGNNWSVSIDDQWNSKASVDLEHDGLVWLWSRCFLGKVQSVPDTASIWKRERELIELVSEKKCSQKYKGPSSFRFTFSRGARAREAWGAYDCSLGVNVRATVLLRELSCSTSVPRLWVKYRYGLGLFDTFLKYESDHYSACGLVYNLSAQE